MKGLATVGPMRNARFAAVAASLFPVSFAFAGDLSAYEGKYPFDPVDGYAFFDNPVVIKAIDGAAGDGTVDWISDLDVASPIERQDDALIATVCEAHNCPRNNAAVAISLGGELIAVCLFSQSGDAGTVPGKLHWVGPKLNTDIEPETGNSGCPRDGSEFLEAYTAALR
jgi:hypothetical protein